MKAPFPYFGGKSTVATDVWQRLGAPSQYIEPFCGSAAMLLAARKPASLEVVGDANGFIANFWRAVKHQPQAVAEWADYPVSHIDLGARHIWLMGRREALGEALQDADWPGCAKTAGWWLWGQCCWIGSGWCDWHRAGSARGQRREGHTGDREGDDATSAGMGIQAIGQVPHAGNAGMGIQAIGKVPHAGNAGRGDTTFLTSGGAAAYRILNEIAARLERVRIVHGSWDRCLNHHFGGNDTAVFLDPPYRAYETLYGVATPVADAVAAWAQEHSHLRVALCGHAGDYDLPGWDAVPWSRGRLTYGGGKTTDQECIWYSPACLPRRQVDLFAIPEDPAEARFAERFQEPEL
jgi:DNA adenine methylase